MGCVALGLWDILIRLSVAGVGGGGAAGGLAGCEAGAHDADGGEGLVGGGNAAAGEKDAVDCGAGERAQRDRGRDRLVEEAQLRGPRVVSRNSMGQVA